MATFNPGGKLSKIETAEKLSSSRTPIRGAFRQLQMKMEDQTKGGEEEVKA